jgi:hypothetical protein
LRAVRPRRRAIVASIRPKRDGRHRCLLGPPVQANPRVRLTFGLGGGNERTSNHPIIRADPGCDRQLHPGAERLRVLDGGVSPFRLPRRQSANDHRCRAGAARGGVDGRLRRCRLVVRELHARRLELRLFLGRAMLGHRARPRRWILCPEPPTRGRPTGRAEAGILPARRGAIGAAISEPDPVYCEPSRLILRRARSARLEG